MSKRIIIFLAAVAISLFGCQKTENQKEFDSSESKIHSGTDGKQRSEKNTGIIFGNGFAFQFVSPKGWLLDNSSGRSQGLDAVLYPEKETWKDSPVMAYARSYAKDNVRTIDRLVTKTLEGLRTNGSPKSKAIKIKIIDIGENKKAVIYHFTEDQWNNLEAIAYIDEEHSINYFVLNAKNKKIFEDSLQSFEGLVNSYQLKIDEGGIRKNEDGRNIN
jgi:hypothetical protein